jgi:DNA-binding MarR family transcriptional regulator
MSGGMGDSRLEDAAMSGGLGDSRLEDALIEVYARFKLQFYKRIFQRFETREASLSLVEAYSIEVINNLGTPTVSEFARFLNISVANATYKVQNLIKKGYLRKERSAHDKRESHLHVTERFDEYNRINNEYISTVAGRILESCEARDIEAFQKVLDAIAADLTPEVRLNKGR